MSKHALILSLDPVWNTDHNTASAVRLPDLPSSVFLNLEMLSANGTSSL